VASGYRIEHHCSNWYINFIFDLDGETEWAKEFKVLSTSYSRFNSSFPIFDQKRRSNSKRSDGIDGIEDFLIHISSLYLLLLHTYQKAMFLGPMSPLKYPYNNSNKVLLSLIYFSGPILLKFWIIHLAKNIENAYFYLLKGW